MFRFLSVTGLLLGCRFSRISHALIIIHLAVSMYLFIVETIARTDEIRAKVNFGAGMSVVEGRADLDFGPLEVCL